MAGIQNDSILLEEKGWATALLETSKQGNGVDFKRAGRLHRLTDLSCKSSRAYLHSAYRSAQQVRRFHDKVADQFIRLHGQKALVIKMRCRCSLQLELDVALRDPSGTLTMGLASSTRELIKRLRNKAAPYLSQRHSCCHEYWLHCVACISACSASLAPSNRTTS